MNEVIANIRIILERSQGFDVITVRFIDLSNVYIFERIGIYVMFYTLKYTVFISPIFCIINVEQ